MHSLRTLTVILILLLERIAEQDGVAKTCGGGKPNRYYHHQLWLAARRATRQAAGGMLGRTTQRSC